jgi:hypothetical protein
MVLTSEKLRMGAMIQNGPSATRRNQMNTSIKIPVAILFGLVCVSGSYAKDTAKAQSAPENTTTTTTTTSPEMRDGFAIKDSQVMITENGKTQVMADDMKLADGVEIRTDGSVIVPGGTTRVLNEGDTMTFDGTITRAGSGKVEHLKPR